MVRLSTKNFIASSTVIFRMSFTFFCLYVTFMTCSPKRRPLHFSQITSTSARNCMSIVTVPAPSHVSHRPPTVLNENMPAVTPLRFADVVSDETFRTSSHALMFVAGFDCDERPIGD